MKRLSILIPVYNVERYIHRCLSSILSQRVEEMEVLLGDDGSKDASGSICDEYAQKHDCVKVFHNPNMGVGEERNFLLECAQGEYIWFVDADDFIQPDAIENILAAVKANGCPDVLSFAYKSCDDAQYSKLQNAFTEPHVLSGVEYLNSYRMDPYLWTKAYRRDFLIENGFRFDERLCIGEDSLLNMQVYATCKNILLTDIYAYNYYRNPNSTLHRPTIEAKRRNAESSIMGFEAFNNFLKTQKDFPAYKALENWQRYGVAGFLHAIMLDNLPLSEIKAYILKLKAMKLYPLKKSDNHKANLFRLLANCKHLFYLACWAHNSFCTKRHYNGH